MSLARRFSLLIMRRPKVVVSTSSLPSDLASFTSQSHSILFQQQHYGFASSSQASPSQSMVDAKTAFDNGITKWNEDDLSGAVKSFEESISFIPSSDAYYNLGNVQFSLQNTEEALANWKKSVELQSRSDALTNIANVHALKLNDFPTAIKYYKEAIALDPEDGEGHYNLACVLDRSGDLEGALSHYSIAVSFGVVQAENPLRNSRAKWVVEQEKLNQ